MKLKYPQIHSLQVLAQYIWSKYGQEIKNHVWEHLADTPEEDIDIAKATSEKLQEYIFTQSNWFILALAQQIPQLEQIDKRLLKDRDYPELEECFGVTAYVRYNILHHIGELILDEVMNTIDEKNAE